MRLRLALLMVCILAGCAQAPEKKAAPSSNESTSQEYRPQYQSSERNKYKPPDGGFGTLDDAREVRQDSLDQQKESESVLDQTQ